MMQFRSFTATGFFLIFALLILCPGSSQSLAAEKYVIEASLSGGSNGNLFADSTEQSETYSSTSLNLDFMPVAFAKASLLGEYTYYTDQIRLSNFLYGGGLTLLPLSDSSRWTIYLDGNLREREYRGSDNDSSGINANEFTGAEYDATLALGYDLSPSSQVRVGLNYNSSEYGVEGVIDKENTETYLGLNTTLFNRLSLDLELGYGGGRFQRINPWVTVFGVIVPLPRVRPENAYDPLFEDNYRSGYLSARLSTSVGARSGLALTYSVRQFDALDEETLIYGYSSGFLSPWVNTYEGQAISGSFKTFLIPRLISQLQIGYWDRSYIRMIERETILNSFGEELSVVDVRLARDRTDYRWRANLTLKMPLTHSQAWFVEPTLSIDYTDNNSGILVYDYDHFQVTGGLTIRF